MTPEKPSPVEFWPPSRDKIGQLNISKAFFRHFLDRSMYWFIRGTIDEVVAAADEVLQDEKLATKEMESKLEQFEEFGMTLRNLNFVYSQDMPKYIGHRFYLLGVFEAPDDAPVIALLLNCFLSTEATGKGSRATNSALYGIKQHLTSFLKETVDRNTYQDDCLAALQAEYLRATETPAFLPHELEKLQKRLRRNKRAIRKQVLAAVKFLGFLFVNKLTKESDFLDVFKMISVGEAVWNPIKFEALCNFVLFSAQLFQELDSIEGTKYGVLYERRRKTGFSIEYLNRLVVSLERALGNLRYGIGEDSDGPRATFEKFKLCIQMRNEWLKSSPPRESSDSDLDDGAEAGGKLKYRMRKVLRGGKPRKKLPTKTSKFG